MIDISHIRSLIDEYYAGTITPERLRELHELFASDSPLPADLIPERALFRTLHQMETEDIEVPRELENRIISHIESIASSEQNHRPRIITWGLRLAVAATVAAIISLSINFLWQPSTTPDNAPAMLAETVIKHDISVTTATPETLQMREVTSPEEAMKYIDKARRILYDNISKANKNRVLAHNKIAKLNSILTDILK